MTTNRRIIREPSQEIEILMESDVVVCGGGPAGVGAALAAARNGARTVLIESQICLGGMGTAGLVNRLGPYHDQRAIILGGIAWEVLRILIDRDLAQEPIICEPANWMDYWLVFDPEGMKLVLDELIRQAGIQVLFGAHVTTAILSDTTIEGVIIESKSGRQAVLGSIVIDATGDGDVAARAGVPFTIGREVDHLLQPATLFFKCLNMDWPRALDFVTRNHARLIEKARAEADIDFLLPGTDSFLHPEETYFNCLHEHSVDGTKIEDISRAAMQLRQKMWRNIEVLRRHVPGCERISLSSSAAALGIRETRRIEGEYELQIEDVLEGRRFEDQVYRYACFIDIHEPIPGEKSVHGDRSLEPGKSYGIPYRCLLPKRVQNLLVAGRCLSATHDALASVRMMPSCIAMGEAVGTAAVLSIQTSKPPRELDVGELRDRLERQGVLL